MRSYALPSKYYVPNLSPVGNTEISGNTIGRTANKGLEGLAITPDGKTLVSIIQAPYIQDANQGGAAANLLRIVHHRRHLRRHPRVRLRPHHWLRRQ